MTKWKLLVPLDFEYKYPNFYRTNRIPCYHGIIFLSDNSWAETEDIRIKDELINKYGFELISVYPPKSSIIKKKEVVEEDFDEYVLDLSYLPDIDFEKGDNGLEYCKVCGIGFKQVNKIHVLSKHDLDWQEYEYLPEMIPEMGMRIYWETPELQKMFPEPMNLLSSTEEKYMNYLDYLKIEGTRKYKELADYFGVPHSKVKIQTLSDYCKVCGIPVDPGTIHYKTHNIDKEHYDALPRVIPNVCMELYWAASDLQRAFPDPLNMKKGYGPFANLLDWMKTDGVRKHKKIKNYYTGK